LQFRKLLQPADKAATSLGYSQVVRRGQLRKAGTPQNRRRRRSAEIAVEMEQLFEKEIELLKNERGLTTDQLVEYEMIATKISRLFSELAKLT